MRYVADSRRNPFGQEPPCDRYVPGYGDPNADFHVIGDHPGVHGGEQTGIPFTDRTWSPRFFEVFSACGLLDAVDLDRGVVDVRRTFLSYLYMCCPENGETPTPDGYAELEPFFDAELRAITAHVLVPVGERPTRHVLKSYTSKRVGDRSMQELHATEIKGAGWLVVPFKEPEAWDDHDLERAKRALQTLIDSDYRQLSDLGRFFPDDNPYYVR